MPKPLPAWICYIVDQILQEERESVYNHSRYYDSRPEEKRAKVRNFAINLLKQRAMLKTKTRYKGYTYLS